jgi:hypothetical protein
LINTNLALMNYGSLVTVAIAATEAKRLQTAIPFLQQNAGTMWHWTIGRRRAATLGCEGSDDDKGAQESEWNDALKFMGFGFDDDF